MKRFIAAQQLLLAFLLCIYTSTTAQSISGNPNEWEEMTFPAQQQIQIKVFMQKVPNWGVQKVWWCAHNLTNDVLDIKFDKVVVTKCGTTLQEPADTRIKGGEKVCGSTFSGELTFETQISNEDCNFKTNRVKSITYRNLKIINVSKQERDQAEKEAKQQQAKADAEKKAAATKSSPSTSSSSGSNSNRTTNTNNAANAAAAQQKAKQQEQERLARQRASEAEARERAWKLEQERYQRELDRMTEKSKQRAATAGAIADGLGGIYNIITTNRLKKYIAAENQQRRDKEKEIKENIETGMYELVDCNRCNSEGGVYCTKCRGDGKVKCNSCKGNPGKTCSNCNGTGTTSMGPYKNACYTCFGKGVINCQICNNTGEDPCSQCNGTGNDFCIYCSGTGKNAVYKGGQGAPETAEPKNIPAITNTQPTEDPAVTAFKKMKEQDLTVIAQMTAKRIDNSYEATTDSIYFLTYSREYSTDKKDLIDLRTYVSYRLPDGYFPFRDDLSISDWENVDNQKELKMIFFFINQRAELDKAIQNMEAVAKKEGLRVKKNVKPKALNTYIRKKITGDEFWNYFENWRSYDY